MIEFTILFRRNPSMTRDEFVRALPDLHGCEFVLSGEAAVIAGARR